MADFFSVVNFERFQHYKDRSPPWIKFYNSTLDDYAYCKLPDSSKAHLHAIWLLASRNNNMIPYDAEWLKAQISATEDIDLQILEDSGFIVSEQGRSNVLATRKQSAIPEESRVEPETEPEKKEGRKKRPAPRKGSRLPSNWVVREKERSYVIQIMGSDIEVEQIGADFKEYFTEGEGRNKTHMDWNRAWQRWVRRQKGFDNKGKPHGRKPIDIRAAAANIAAKIASDTDDVDGGDATTKHHTSADRVQNFDLPGDIIQMVDRGGDLPGRQPRTPDAMEILSDHNGNREGVQEGGPLPLGGDSESGASTDAGEISGDPGRKRRKPQADSGFEVPF